MRNADPDVPQDIRVRFSIDSTVLLTPEERACAVVMEAAPSCECRHGFRWAKAYTCTAAPATVSMPDRQIRAPRMPLKALCGAERTRRNKNGAPWLVFSALVVQLATKMERAAEPQAQEDMMTEPDKLVRNGFWDQVHDEFQGRRSLRM